jgi:hypothetical protein
MRSGSAHGEVQLSAGLEYAVAPAVGVHSSGAACGQQSIFGIEFAELRGGVAGAGPRVAGADQPMQMFDGASFAEFAGEPVQQERVIGSAAHASEVG